MARLVALLVLVVAVCTVSAYLPQPQQCGPHEEWVSCGRPEYCEPKCNQSPVPVCPAVCVSRCQCQKGYFRNNLNLCVLSSNCEEVSIKLSS